MIASSWTSMEVQGLITIVSMVVFVVIVIWVLVKDFLDKGT